jgi:NADPH:quinone reductase-like Zn-dependent oxidoreductase
MRAAGIAEPNGEVRALDVADPRPPREDEVLIDVRASGVGNWDELMRQDGWPSKLTPPFALGVEAAGVVSAVGSGVTGRSVGDAVLTHVYPFRDNGAWAQRLLAPADLVAAKPPGMSWQQAAALPIPVLTARQTVAALRLRSGDRVLVHGAGGVTGGLLVWFAARGGADVIATAGEHGAERAAALGATTVVDYADPSWPQTVGTVDAAVNAAPDGSAAALAAVADGGRFVAIADSEPDAQRDIEIQYLIVAADGPTLDEGVAWLAADGYQLPIAREFPLALAAEALELVASGTSGAAVVLVP